MAYAVLTRDPADAQAYAAALAPLEIVAMPVTKTVAGDDSLARALEQPFDAILIASPRAAHELARATGDRSLPAVWAVGPATRRALEIAKLPAHHPPGVRDGAELARAFVASGAHGKRVLVPRAEEGRTEPLDLLRAAGAEVVDVIAYRTVAVAADDPTLARGKQLLLAGEAPICAVFAPSQVAALAIAIGPLSAIATRFCAIGETTAAALAAAGVAEVAVAPAPSPEGMAQAVRSVYPPR